MYKLTIYLPSMRNLLQKHGQQVVTSADIILITDVIAKLATEMCSVHRMCSTTNLQHSMLWKQRWFH